MNRWTSPMPRSRADEPVERMSSRESGWPPRRRPTSTRIGASALRPNERRDVVRVESSEVDLVDHASDQHVPPVVERQLAAREDEHPQVRGVGEDFPEERKE